MPPAFVLSQDQTLNKKFNLLLKLLWVFNNLKTLKRIAGFILTIFCSIFKDHICYRFKRLSYLITYLTLCQQLFSKFFSHRYLSDEIYLITYPIYCQHFVFVFLFLRHQRRDLSYHLIYSLFCLFMFILWNYNNITSIFLAFLYLSIVDTPG